MFISFLLWQFPMIAIVCAALCFVIFLLMKARGKNRAFVRYFMLWGFMCYCAALVYFTLLWYWPDITFAPEWHLLNLEPFIWTKETYQMGTAKMLGQLALNIGMFVPMGLMLPIVSKRMRHIWSTALVSLGATLAIETLQFFMGRSADIDDVIMNFAGAVLGYLIFKLLSVIMRNVMLWNKALANE